MIFFGISVHLRSGFSTPNPAAFPSRNSGLRRNHQALTEPAHFMVRPADLWAARAAGGGAAPSA
jgi:hypothetical protein